MFFIIVEILIPYIQNKNILIINLVFFDDESFEKSVYFKLSVLKQFFLQFYYTHDVNLKKELQFESQHGKKFSFSIVTFIER